MFDRKYLLKSPFKTARLSRLLAKSIDLFIVAILSTLLYPLGIFLAVTYISVSDSLQSGQSMGKKFIGMAVLSLKDGLPCTLKQSFIRNLPISLPLFLAIFPLWGWLLAILIGIPLLSLELYLLFTLDSGHRLGDVMADTTVMANDPKHIQNQQKKKSTWFQSETHLSL
ncbi:MAG: RDD family protein [Oligoflexia bacterium]|nr:RDD family protein [Oligoflexia bacterium]